MSSIGEVVRGNVSSLFGRFRPPAGLSAEEIKAAKAERIEFGDRLVPMLRLMDSHGRKVEKAVRTVFRELQGEPASNAMPTPDTIAARVREKLSIAEHRPPCPACTEFGGSPGIFSDSPAGTDVLRGDVQIERDWWCTFHFPIITWYQSRQARYEDGLQFTYSPPHCIIPKAAFVAGAKPDHYYEYTDGALMCALALWTREYLEGLTGKAILDERIAHV